MITGRVAVTVPSPSLDGAVVVQSLWLAERGHRCRSRGQMSNIPVARVVRGNVDPPSGGEGVKPSGRVLQLARRELPRGLMCRVLLEGRSWCSAGCLQRSA